MKNQPHVANYISGVIVLLFMVLLMVSPQSRADDKPSFVVGLHIGSQHTNDPKGLANNLNPGLYGRLDNGFTAGFYKNSLHKDTAYAGWTTTEFWRFSLTLGLASGYRNDGQAFNMIPIIVPSARLVTFDPSTMSLAGDPAKEGTYSLRLTVIPRIYAEGQDIFHFMAERRF
jgi:hypothetical protein